MGIKAKDIAFVRFNASDLDKMESFLVEFGLVRAERTGDTLYMRGTDDDGFIHVTHLADQPGFAGFALLANSVEDLETLARVDGFSEVGDLAGPGGGRVISTVDPLGFQLEVVADRGSLGTLPLTSPARNDASVRDRFSTIIRVTQGPSHVKRLGHLVLSVADFPTTADWYKSTFGMIATDEVLNRDGTRTMGAFLRCDQGAEFVDHHSLFLLGTGDTAYNHAAFEVADFDDLMGGHTHLRRQDLAELDHTHSWGVGRHFLGSQVFDYWLDPWGHLVEHWTDGDLFDNTAPTNVESFRALVDSQWGPTVAKEELTGVKNAVSRSDG
jgi:catechol 2,3-dioxygenase-like lactoylglutathione lyase family enzyme